MQSADVMVAISNAMTSSPNLVKFDSALVIMVESPHSVFEQIDSARGDWNGQ